MTKKAYGLYDISEKEVVPEKIPKNDDLSEIIENLKKRMAGKSYEERLAYLTILLNILSN